MIERIKYKKEKYAIIIRSKYKNKNGISFFSGSKDNQQIGFMSHKKNHIIYPHVHKKRNSKIFYTTEVIVLLKGVLRVDFYNNKKKYLFSKKLFKNDIIYLIKGGHGFKVIRPVKMLEIKQGPYIKSKDKVKFLNINEKKIRLKK